MRIIIHFLFLALVCTQELVDYDTYAEYHNQYKTILNWSFDKHPEEVYPSLLQMVDSLNLPDSIVVKSNFVDFFMKNPRFFKKPGVYLSFEENITFFQFNEEHKLVQQLRDFMDPSIQVTSDPDQFLQEDTPRMLIIIPSEHENYQKLNDLVRKLKKANRLMNNIAFYDNQNYNQYQAPTIIGKDAEGRILQFNKDLFSTNDVSGFSSILQLNYVNEFNYDTASNILNNYIDTQLLILFGKDQSKNEEIKKALTNISMKFNNQFIFAYGEWEDNQRFWKLMTLSEQTDKPQVILLKQDASIYFTRKFNYPYEEVNEEKLEEFLNQYNQGNRDEFFTSEPIPEQVQIQDGFKKVVGRNFKEEVLENDENVLVLFYNSKQKDYLEEVTNQYLRMVQFVTEEDQKRVKLVYLDMYENEIDNVKFKNVPCYGLYKKDEKKQVKIHEIDFEQLNADTLREWLTDELGWTKVKEEKKEEEVKKSSTSDL